MLNIYAYLLFDKMFIIDKFVFVNGYDYVK